MAEGATWLASSRELASTMACPWAAPTFAFRFALSSWSTRLPSCMARLVLPHRSPVPPWGGATSPANASGEGLGLLRARLALVLVYGVVRRCWLAEVLFPKVGVARIEPDRRVCRFYQPSCLTRVLRGMCTPLERQAQKGSPERKTHRYGGGAGCLKRAGKGLPPTIFAILLFNLVLPSIVHSSSGMWLLVLWTRLRSGCPVVRLSRPGVSASRRLRFVVAPE